MQNCMRKILLTSCLLLCGAVLAWAQPAASYPLGKVEFVGLKKYDRQQALTASELKTGQSVTLAALDAAAKKLAALGYFRRVNYRYQLNNNKLDVVFEVEEAGGAVPCVFDNFAGFTDRELVEEVRKEIPSFDGTAPEVGDSVQKVKVALERILQKRGLPGQVEHLFSVGSEGFYRPEHVFTIKDLHLNICKVRVLGAASVPMNELQPVAQQLVGSEYSKINARGLAELDLMQVFRKYGYLRARFGLPLGELDFESKDCKDGVSVTLPVDAGASYSWDRAEWAGNQALPTPFLDVTVGMRAGDVADGPRIDKGLRTIYEAYVKKGYLAARLQPAPEFDDANKRVILKVAISEGPQFRMGTLTILGIPPADVQRCKERWQLKAGDVYDGTYVAEFIQRIVKEGIVKLDAGKNLKVEPKPDAQKQSVDVTINFDAKVQ